MKNEEWSLISIILTDNVQAMKPKIEDGFLEQTTFNKLQNFLMSNRFDWHYSDTIDFSDDGSNKFQFTHIFYVDPIPRSSYFENLVPILEIIKPISIVRIKANLLTKTLNIIENIFHGDMEDMLEEKQKQWTTSILYINTNDGYTKFEGGTKVESVANRMITFPADMKHTGATCTDEKSRVVINFNYIDSK